MQRIAISDLRSLMYPNQEDGKDISDEELMKFQFISSNNLVQNSQGNMGQKDKYKIDDKVKFELEKQSQINNPLKTIMNIGQKIVGVTSNDSHYRRTSVIKSYRESIAHPNSNGLFVRPRARKMSAILTESNRIHVRKDKIESYKRNIKRFDIYFKPRKSTGRSQTVDYADLRIQLQSRFPIDQTIHKQKKEAFQQETKRFYNKQIKKRLTRGKSQPQYPILEAVTVHINEQIDTQIFKFIVNSGYMRKDFFFNMYMEDEKQKFNEHQMLYIRHPNLFKSDRQFESYINKKKEFFQEILEIYPHKKSKLEAIFKYLKYGEQEILEYENDIDERQIIAEKLGPWSELWEFKQKIIAESSPFGQFKSYQLRPFIVKGGDDLRQELVAMQLISKFDQIFKIHDTGLWLRPYQIIVKNSSSGFLEFCTDTYSINSLKKKDDQYSTILQFFINTFINDREVKKAQDNFVKSLAAYSIVCYLLQIKDRHNGNILLDAEGHIIHIDFGFMLGISPGGINLEAPTFQLTDEYLDVLNHKTEEDQRGKSTNYDEQFQNLMIDGFKALSGHVEEICNMLEIMAENSDLPCFQKFDMVSFRDRFKENHTEQQRKEYVQQIIKDSIGNLRTGFYDTFQLKSNGILP